MDVSRRRGGARGSVVPGSVWESRMKSDEVRGGIKVFNGEESSEEAANGGTRLRSVPVRKRKTWKSESSEEFDRNQIHIARGKSEPHKNCREMSKGLGISLDGIEKNPIHTRKISASAEKLERSLILTRRPISASPEGPETNSERPRKSRSDSVQTANQNVGDFGGSGNGNVENAIQLRKVESESDEILGESNNKTNGETEEIPVNDPHGVCKDFVSCQEKAISSSSEKVGAVKVKEKEKVVDEEGETDEEREVVDEDIKNEKETFDVKEINVAESKVVIDPEKKKAGKEPENMKVVNELQHKEVLSIQRRFQQNEGPVSIPLTVKQSSPIKRHSTMHQNFRKSNSVPKAEEYHRFPQTQNKLQSLVDLIMWRDVPRSAFVFGFGTFIIISSSYAKDINVSSISVMSYLGLVYLAVIFLYRSFICRGVIDLDGTNYVLGEEEAIWVLKLILPYLNEFLLKLRALFSGDPGTTIKLAVLLFVLARWGSSITIWKMAKFGFFGVFTVPKIYSLYSAQLIAYANLWVQRLRDAWDSCSHKKAVALGIFGLVWNLSSLVVRIWAVFVLFATLRYYQQNHLGRGEWVEDEAGCEETGDGPVGVGGQRQGCQTPFLQTHKLKKGF